MSKHSVEQITCPKCGKNSDFEFWNSVNTSENPEMIPKVLDGSIFDFKCPHCGHQEKALYPLLYDDMSKGFMIYYCSKTDIEDCTKAFQRIKEITDFKEVTQNCRYRIVTTTYQLTEKIKILVAGLDDRMIEILKTRQKEKAGHILFDIIRKPDSVENELITALTFYSDEGEFLYYRELECFEEEIEQILKEEDFSGDDEFVVDEEWVEKVF